jgi:hypothetical protein
VSEPTPEDLRSAADVLEVEWRGGWYDTHVGFNDEGIGVPAVDRIAEMRAEADRLDVES